MLNFAVNRQTCNHCGHCAADCPARIIRLDEDGFPAIAADQEPACYRCQHCLAICPPGAISILGRQPEDSLPLARHFPDPLQMETLIKGRRAVRRYREENLPPELIAKLLEVAGHAPSGRNARQVRFTLVDDRTRLAGLRDELITLLRRRIEAGLPERLSFFAGLVKLWDEEGIDFLFRGAPHLLITSAPGEVATPIPDCLIALSYFELYAQSQGLGTVWDGLATWAISDLAPEIRPRLGIPADHVIGYAMAFGRPAVKYARTVQHGQPLVHVVR